MRKHLINIKITINEANLIPEIAKFITKHAINCGVESSKERILIRVIKTSLKNRIKDNLNYDGHISVFTYIEKEQYVIAIQDKGTPYFIKNKNIKLLKNGLCDNYSFLQLGRAGIITSFCYNLSNQIDKPSLIKEEKLLDNEFTIKKTSLSDNDINEVIKCLYEPYKYDYLHQSLYKFDEFRNELKSGFYHSFLIENKHHQVVAHAALHEYYPFNGLPEFCNLVTKSIARGNGLAGKAINHLTEFAKDNKYNGVLVCCFAPHPITEKICNKMNYTPCACMFQVCDPCCCGEFKKLNARLDLLDAVTLFDKSKKHTIYAPEFTKPLLDFVFGHEQVKYELISSVNEGYKAKENKITYSINVLDKAMEVFVESFNSHLTKNIKDMVKHRKDAGVEVVTFYINATNPSAITSLNLLYSYGFIFTGIIPGSSNGDYLVMQNLLELKFTTKYIAIEKNYDTLIDIVKKINNLTE